MNSLLKKISHSQKKSNFDKESDDEGDILPVVCYLLLNQLKLEVHLRVPNIACVQIRVCGVVDCLIDIYHLLAAQVEHSKYAGFGVTSHIDELPFEFNKLT